MIKNYIKTALRTLRRNKLFSLINILGLSVGLSAALIIYLIVQYDFQMITPSWDAVSSGNQFFVRLEKSVRPQQIVQQLAALRKKYSNDNKDTANKYAHLLQPLTAMHFTGDYDAYGQP
jgi:hypothetical protein